VEGKSANYAHRFHFKKDGANYGPAVKKYTFLTDVRRINE